MNLRVLLLLWHLADRWGRVGADGVRLDLDLTHELIARMIGASREMVSRVVKDLHDKGVIRAEKRKIYVLDRHSMGGRRASSKG